MHQYPEVFRKAGASGATRAPSAQQDPPRPVVKIRPVHSDNKEVQTSTSNLLPTDPQDPEVDSYRPARPRTVIKIPSPVPLGTAAESLAVDLIADGRDFSKLHSAKSWRHSLIAQSVMLKNAKTPSVSFDNEEIRGKLLPGDAYRRTSNRSCLGARPKTRATMRPLKSQSAALAPIEGKPLTARSTRRSHRTLSTAVEPVDPPSDYRFVAYTLGHAGVPPQFALPSAYSLAFGQVVSEAERRHEILQLAATLFHIPHSSTSAYRVTQLFSDFYIMTTGTLVPISKCCRAPIVLHLCAEVGGKVLCTAWHCSNRTLYTFRIPDADRERVWGGANAAKKNVSAQIRAGGHRSRSLRNSVARKVNTSLEEHAHFPAQDAVFSPEKPRRQSQDPHPFGLKVSLTLGPHEQSQRPFESSPIRRVLARGRHQGLCSLEELKEAWADVEVTLC